MMVPDGSRTRTLGGILFYLVRTQVSDAEVVAINAMWRSKHKRKKLGRSQGQAEPPMPAPPTLPPFVWDEAAPIIAELTAHPGAATTVKVTVGRPNQIVE
jgi:hypothetical protein